MNNAEESLGYPLDEALADADRWVDGSTMYHGIRGWRPACAVLACEVRAIGNAGIKFRFLHAARRIGHIRRVSTKTCAEQLHAAARAGRFDQRRFEIGIVAGEAFSHRLGKREYGGRSDRTDRIASAATFALAASSKGKSGKRNETGCFNAMHGKPHFLQFNFGHARL